MIRRAGFTLVEMVLVLVLLGVLSIGLAAFIDNATDHYADTAERARLLGEARLALTRMGREIEGAVPYSLRIDSSEQCLELLPAREGGRYQEEAGQYASGATREPLPVGETANSFHALGFAGVGTDDEPVLLQTDEVEYVAVYPAPPADDYIYGAGPDPSAGDDVALRPFADATATSTDGVVRVELSGSTAFPRHAPEPRRFFLAGSPVSFCLEGGDLLRYEGYELQANQPVPPDGSGVSGRPLARGLADDSTFELEPAGLERRGLVRARLELERQSDGEESLVVEHAFSTRNHP
ncbi:prepilin-type N-terminal cleavage/methylation domain-containing protein [Thiohalospira sp.]|uniref:prepilin-type N-terminal cleavage/methylation domain-containing protein n=1 Tax=Thiohalospira sp. TaxID=3080549 RepID=UPI003980F30F